MREIGRGARAFEAGPVQGTVSAGASPDAPAASGRVVLLLDDETTSALPHGADPVVAVVCGAGTAGDPLAEACTRAGIPCVMGAIFDGGPPNEGSLVVVDCSGDVGVVMVVDGGVTEGGLEDVVATQAPD